jgi:hypothetical protein
MNPRKDILLIALGALFFVAGLVAFAALQMGVFPGIVKPIVLDDEAKAAAIRQLHDLPPLGAAYPSSPRASLEDNVKDWLSPEENEDNWDYDLFTTIDVVWDPALKDYVPRRRKAEVMPPFGISLVSVGHPTYPFMLSSTLTPRSGKPEDREFSLQNIKTKQYIDHAKIKKPIEDAPYLTILAFEVVKEKDADGFVNMRNVLTVEDRQFGQTVQIDDVKPLEFKGRTDILITSTSDPSWTKTLHAVGDKFNYKEAVYTVKGIDLASKTVTFDKHFAPNPKKPKKTFSEVLSVPPPPPPPPPKAKSTPAEKPPTKK